MERAKELRKHGLEWWSLSLNGKVYLYNGQVYENYRGDNLGAINFSRIKKILLGDVYK